MSITTMFSSRAPKSAFFARSDKRRPKDVAYVFFTVAVGLASGMGFLTYALLFALILCLAMIVLEKSHFGNPKDEAMTLKIAIPEDLNYEGLFDDLLKEYTSASTLKRIRTTEFGTLFELVYRIRLKAGTSQKEFLDKLRCRNGNLSISLVLSEYEDRVYDTSLH